MSKFLPETEAFARLCPKTWKAISEKRYLLPNYRQADYDNWIQSTENFKTYFDYLLLEAPMEGHFFNHFENLCRALDHKRPTYFLEREVGEMFCRMKLHNDLQLNDIKWKFPQMRIVLPHGLLRLDGEDIDGIPGPFSYSYIDIVRVDKDRLISLPEEIALELEACGPFNQVLEERKRSSLLSIIATPRSSDGFGVCSTGVTPEGKICYRTIWDRFDTLDIAKINQSLDLKGHYSGDDQQWFLKAQHLALLTLLFMSSSPEDYKLLPEMVGKPGNGKRPLQGPLYHAKFVGECQRKYVKNEPQTIAAKIPKSESKIARVGHWVAGHIRSQPFGSGSSSRKLIWIQPYYAEGNKDNQE